RLPHLLVRAVDAMHDPRIELDRPYVRVEIEADAIADDRGGAGHLSVFAGDRPLALGIGPAHRAQQDQIGRGAALLRALGPVAAAVLQVELPAPGDVSDAADKRRRVP